MNDEIRRRPAARAAVGAVALLATGALIALVAVRPDAPSFTGIEQIPLPGGADLGDRPYEVTAEFGDVLSLAPQSSVKVNDVSVGRVTKITLSPDGWRARVTMQVNGEVELPANAYARLEQ
ncbi:MCE family protein, partial [Streptomyces sp. SID7982]|nr:MCE family protein [Streptomyces sp. SID7982]